MSGDVAALFRSMTNEIVNSKILTCPADSKRSRETNWVKLSNKNISYFIGLDSDETRPQTILSGDRNLSGGVLLTNRVVEVRATNLLVWGADIHRRCGNIGLGDGSAQQVNDRALQNQASNQARILPVTRLAFP